MENRRQEHCEMVTRCQQRGATTAAGGGEEPWPVQPAVRGGQSGVLGPQSPHPCRCGNRDVRDDSRWSRMRRDLDEAHTEELQYSAESS